MENVMINQGERSQEEIQELRIQHAKRMMAEQSLPESEREEWEKEFKKQTKEAVRMKDNQFKRIMQSGGEQADIMESFVKNINPFEMLNGG